MSWKTMILVSIIWISCAAVAIYMKDAKILAYAIGGTFVVGLLT